MSDVKAIGVQACLIKWAKRHFTPRVQEAPLVEATKLATKQETSPAPGRALSWGPIEQIRRQIDHAFEAFSPRGLLKPRSFFEWDVPSQREIFRMLPPVDVTESDQQYEITVELPGMEQKDIDLKITSGVLTIKGEKKEEKDLREEEYCVSERRYGSFVRSFSVPQGVDVSKIEAKFINGVLTILLPKSPEARKNEKKIEIATS